MTTWTFDTSAWSKLPKQQRPSVGKQYLTCTVFSLIMSNQTSSGKEGFLTYGKLQHLWGVLRSSSFMDGWMNEKATWEKAPLDLIGSTRSINLWVNKIQSFPLSINRFNKYHGSPWVKMIIWPVDERKCSKIFIVLLGVAVLLKFHGKLPA